MRGADIAEIQNTLNRAMLAMDRGDGNAFAACFHAGARCFVRISSAQAEGPDALAALCRAIHAKFPTCRHWEGNVCVTPDSSGHPDLCTNESYWKALDGGECVSTGLHRDTLRKGADGTWKIAERAILHTWTKAGGHIAVD